MDLILSDLHANLHALRAVLRYIRRRAVQRFILLGDLAGYGAHPNQENSTRPFCKTGEMKELVAGAAEVLHLDRPAEGALGCRIETGNTGDGRILRQRHYQKRCADFYRTSRIDAYRKHQVSSSFRRSPDHQRRR